jgi:dynactin 1
MTQNLRAGQRVCIQSGTYAGSEGFVRFVGTTSFKEGVWIGLELDEPSGKNNGSVAGVTYFNCKPQHGIFLKSGSAIDVLEETKPPAPKPAARSSMAPPKTPASGRVPGAAAVKPRTSVAAPTTGRRPSVAPSVSSSTSSAGKRMSISSQATAPTRTSRLSTVERSISPQKTTTPIASRMNRASVTGLRAGTRSPVSSSNSVTPSIDKVISPASVKSDQNTTSTQPTRSAPATATSTKVNLQQNKLVEELQTKVTLLEKKRAEDREKVKRMSELEEKIGHFENVIQKLNGKCQSLHQENGEMKKNIAESSSRLDELETMNAEHESIQELAFLDRQLAEDHAESYKSELENVRARLEELELENDILREEKEEFEKDMSPEEKASQGWMQMQRENARLKDALIRLRDWSQEQHDNLKEEIKDLQQDSTDLTEAKDKLDDTKTNLLATQAENEDLREQLDAALGAETMVEDLTEKNLNLSAQIDEVRKTVEHLEFVQELNEELEINHVEHEKQLQEIIDVKESQVAELGRRIIKQEEELTDREYTISKFRELVTGMNANLEDMRASKEISETEAQNLENSSRAIMDLNRQLQASANNVTVKAIDVELRQLEADQASLQLSILQLFVPEAFHTEKDSILSLLRFKRIGFKARLLHGFIKQRLSGSVAASNTINVHAACEALDKLVWTSTMSDRFVASMETSPVEQFARYDSAYHELETTERALNGYIENLKKDELQEQQVAEGLSRSIAVIKHLSEIYLTNNLEAFAEDVLMRAQVFQSELENAATVLAALQSDMLNVSKGESEDNEDNEDLTLFRKNSDSTLSALRTAKVVAGKLHTVLRDMSSRSLSLDPESESQFDKCGEAASAIFEYFKVLTKSAVRVLTEEHAQPVTFIHVLTVLRQVSSDHLKTDSPDLFYKPQKLIKGLTDWMNELHAQASEFSNLTEFEKPQPPWILRSKEMQNRKAISAVAEEEIKNLKRDLQDRATKLKLHQQQLEESQMKIELLNQRNKDANKKLDQISDLETQLKSSKEHAKSLEQTVNTQAATTQKLEEERDRWMRRAAELKPTQKSGNANGHGAEMVGTSAQMEALKIEIATLQSANRALRSQFRRLETKDDANPHSWLSLPLRTSRSANDDKAANMRAALNSIALLPLQVRPVRILGKGKTSAYGKETPRWQLGQVERRGMEVWGGIDDLVKEIGGGLRRPLIAGVDVAAQG